MKRKIPEIYDSIEDIEQIMKKEKRIRFYKRIQVLYMLKKEKARTVKGVADLLGLKRHTVGRWLRLYEKEGIERLLRINTSPNNPPRIKGNILNKLKEKLSSPEGFNPYGETAERLKENHNLTVKYGTVWRTVNHRLGAGLKTPRPSHIKKDKKKLQSSEKNFHVK